MSRTILGGHQRQYAGGQRVKALRGDKPTVQPGDRVCARTTERSVKPTGGVIDYVSDGSFVVEVG